MSTPAKRDSELGSYLRGASECKPLLETATRDLFRRNAFRITGLSVDATTREVARHSDKLKMLAELGQDPHTQSAAFPIKPPPTFDDIRAAIQKLKEPEKRIIDEFFWLWPEEFGNGRSDPAIQALAAGDLNSAIDIWSTKEKSPADGMVATHNLALVFHINALDWENYAVKSELEGERRQKVTNYWKGAFSRWERLVTSEAFWEIVTARIRQLNEPTLTTGFVRRMRSSLPDALIKVNAELALSFAESGRSELARLHIHFMRETNQGLSNVEKIAELVLTPTICRFKDQIKRAEERVKCAPQDGASTAKELFQHTQRAAFLLNLFYGEKNPIRNELLDEAIAVCNRLQVAYHDAMHDDETCLEILNSVLPLATSSELREQIEKNIATLKGFAADKRLEPIYAVLKSIQDSKENPSIRLALFKSDAIPAIAKASGISGFSESSGYHSVPSSNYNELFDSAAIVLRVISLDAWNNHHDRQTAVVANELAIKHANSPELKQRLAEDKRTLQQMRYEADLTPISSAPSLSTINGIGLKLYGSSDRDPSTGSYLSTYYFVFFYIPIFPICRYRVTSDGNSYRFFGKAPLRTCDKWHLAISIAVIIGFIVFLCSSDGGSSPSASYTPQPSPTYNPPAQSVPAYTPPASSSSDANFDGNAYRVPSYAASDLDLEKSQIEADRIVLKQMEDDLDALGKEIESDRITLDQTSQYAVDKFNEKVDRYNALSQKAKAATSAFNQRVDNYNARLRQYER